MCAGNHDIVGLSVWVCMILAWVYVCAHACVFLTLVPLKLLNNLNRDPL